MHLRAGAAAAFSRKDGGVLLPVFLVMLAVWNVSQEPFFQLFTWSLNMLGVVC